jgi:hypothetical protein
VNDQAAHRLRRRSTALVTEYVRELAAEARGARRPQVVVPMATGDGDPEVRRLAA